MWQAYALGSIAFNCLENIIDKRAMLRVGNNIDSSITTFIRVLFYWFSIVLVTASANHLLVWYCSPSIVAFGLISTLMSTSYTIILKRANITTIAVLGYIAPLIFLFIDHTIGNHFTAVQIIAICGLVLGGIGFTMDGRLTFDRVTLSALAFMLVFSGGEIYYMKWIFKTQGVPIASVLVNIWGWTALFMTLYVIVARKVSLIFTRDVFIYAKYCTFSKLSDACMSLIWSIGITMTTVAQFTSLQAFFPLIMLALALSTQIFLKIDLGEHVEQRAIIRKAAMAIILMVSSLFV